MFVPQPKFSRHFAALNVPTLVRTYGRVRKVVGLVVESTGPTCRVGDLVSISHDSEREEIIAEVVGFRDNTVLIMPFGETNGVRVGAMVRNLGSDHTVPFGSAILGRVLDGLGRPIDGSGLPEGLQRKPAFNTPPHPLRRQMIHRSLSLGVRSIDALATMGVGQRIGVFAGSGVGKSTLLGMVARNTSADVNVIALVGERGREVREFIEHDLGAEGLERSVVVVATSEQPALVRVKAAFTATAIAEGFRDEGRDVLLMMDSVTRFAMAQREIGLAIGEPPSSKGYTPSVFALLPRLLERTGNAERGSISAIYTILVEGDDTNEPIADTVRAILDGHIVLSRKLANAGHFPAVDVLSSLSRVMPLVTSEQDLAASNRLRELIAAYRDVEDLVSIGAYQKGSRPNADEAIEKWETIRAFLRQGRNESSTLSDSVARLRKIVDA